MTRTVRSRRAESANLPLYARALRLRHLAPSGLLCFVFLEGAIVLGILLALAELVSWWGVLVLPAAVALMVKFNDLIAGSLTQQQATTETATARATVLRPAAMSATPAPPTVPARRPTLGPASAATFSSDPAYGSTSSAAESSSTYGHTPSAPTGYASSASEPLSAYGYPPSASAPSTAYGYTPSVSAPSTVYGSQGSAEPTTGDARSANGPMPAVYGTGSPAPMPAPAGYPHTGPIAGAPGVRASGAGLPVAGGAQVRRQWAEQLDVRQQMARQSAVRRYE